MVTRIRHAATCAMALTAAICASAFGADPVKIGWIVPLTGAFSVSGAAETYGVESEIARINAAGGLLGRKLVLVPRDSASDPSKALSVANELIYKEKVDAMMGPGSSGEAFPIMDVLAKANLILITPCQADPLIDPVKRPYTYRAMPTLGAVALRTVDFTKNTLKQKKVAIFADSTGYGTVVADLLKSAYEKAGSKPQLVTLINTNQADVTPELMKARTAGVDEIQVWTSATGLMARILNARGAMGWNVPVVGHTNLVGKEVRSLVDKPEYLKDIYAISYSNTIYDEAGRLPPESQAFVDQFGKGLGKYSNSPFFNPLVGASLVQIYAAGVKKAVSFESAKVAAALNTMGPIKTAFGTFTYSARDHNGFALSSMDFVGAGSEVEFGNRKLKLH
jgi:branched-chain amino acid transport system substrate-binding protein